MSVIGEEIKLKILFVVDDLQGHGVTTSLINLLSIIDRSKLDVSLLVLNMSEAVASAKIPDYIRTRNNDKSLEAFFERKSASIVRLMKMKKWRLLFYRVLVAMESKTKGRTRALQANWEKIIASVNIVEDEYDIVIGFQDYTSGVYALKKIKSKVYVGWNHNIYEYMGYDDLIMKKYYDQLNCLCTISKATKASLEKTFGEELIKKTLVIPNALDTCRIERLKKEKIQDLFFTTEKKRILSIGRLVEQKGFDFAIEVASALVDKGIDFIWYIIGTGEQRELLQELILKRKLENNIKLYGYSDNPYPFILNSDVYVQPSRYEGYGIAISEAVYLKTPVIITPDAGERYSCSEIATILPFGNINEWADAIEKVITIDNKKTEYLFDENSLVIQAFNDMIQCSIEAM